MSSLIYHYGALGDFLTALPAFTCFKKQFPGPVTLLGKPSFGALVKPSGYVDSVLDADAGSYRFLFTSSAPEATIRPFLNTFSAILLFTAEDAAIAVNIRRCFSGTVIRQDPLPPDSSCHAIDRHCALFPETAPKLSCRYPGLLTLPESNLTPLDESVLPSQPFIVIHPGSGSRDKNWPFENFLSVAAAMKSAGYHIVWITGPAESSLSIPGDDRHLEHPDLATVLLLASRSAAYLGNDSGITHLAAAAGAKVVALFGPSDPSAWAPRGSGACTIIHHPPAAGCSPCHLHVDKLSQCSHQCMNEITVREVLVTLNRLLIPGGDDEDVSL